MHATDSQTTLTARKVWGIRRWVECRLATFSEIVVMAWESPDWGERRDSLVTFVRVLYGPGKVREFQLRKPLLDVSEEDIVSQLPLTG